MPLPWTQTLLSLRNPIDLGHCIKSQQDYIPISQPSLFFRNMKRGQFITVSTAPSATKARQSHCACMALILCWDSGCRQLTQVSMYSKQFADIPLPGKWSWLWKWIETSLAIGQKQRGIRPSSILNSTHLQFDIFKQTLPSISSFLFMLWMLPHYFDSSHPHPRNSRISQCLHHIQKAVSSNVVMSVSLNLWIPMLRSLT